MMKPRKNRIALICLTAVLGFTGLACSLSDQIVDVTPPTATPFLTATPSRVISPNAASAAQTEQWTVGLADDFSADNGDWVTGQDSGDYADIDRQIQDGVYAWDIHAWQSTHLYSAPDMDPVSDFSVSVDTRLVNWVSGGMDAALGLDFRIQDSGEKYNFAISDDYYCFSEWTDNDWKILIDWTQSPAIQSRKPNRVQVVAVGSDFAFYVNDTLVDTWSDADLPNGTIGVMVELYNPDDQAQVTFDQFEIRTP